MPERIQVSVRELFREFKWDLVVIVILSICGIVFETTNSFTFKRMFFIDDEKIAYPDNGSTVPNWVLPFLGFVFPIAFVGIMGFLNKSPLHSFPNLIFSLLQAIVLNFFITNFLKHTVGRHRPDFLSRCELPNGACTAGVACSPSLCEGESKVWRQGLLSFPSGHASITFTGMVFITVFCWYSLRPVASGRFGALCVCLSPTALATWVAITRTQDYKHNWEDVLVGAIIGAVCAYLGFVMGFNREHSILNNSYPAMIQSSSKANVVIRRHIEEIRNADAASDPNV